MEDSKGFPRGSSPVKVMFASKTTGGTTSVPMVVVRMSSELLFIVSVGPRRARFSAPGSMLEARKQQQRLEKFVQKVLKHDAGAERTASRRHPRGTQAGAMSIPAEWFGIADVDGDGKVSGGEAVAFFTRAGLPQASLATLWELADNPPRGFLERKQFDVAMQLITVAQVRTRVCRRVVFSLSRTPKTSFVGDLARSRARRPVGRDPSSAFQTSHLRCRSDVAHLRRAAGS